MALMFLGFGVYFYYDASTGYPQKNLEFFMHKAFVDAGALFDREVSGNGASPQDWERTVLERTVRRGPGRDAVARRSGGLQADVRPRQGLERRVAILFRRKTLPHQAGGPPV